MESLRSILALLLLLLLVSLTAAAAAAAEEEEEGGGPAMTAYEVLRSNGLPAGLLPKGVREFRVDGEGRFEVNLDFPCTAKFETEVQYAANVSGVLSYGQIAALSGVTAQELFLWFPVHSIRVDIPSSGLIYFDVGVIHKQFSLSLFETPPDCEPLPSSSHLSRLVDKSKSGKAVA